MNERIKELAKRAQQYADQQWLEAGYPSWETYSEVFAEDFNSKFAALIVAECVNLIEAEAKNADEDSVHGMRNAAGLISRAFITLWS